MTLTKRPINNSQKEEQAQSKAAIFLSSAIKMSENKEGLAEFSFSGYSGAAVDLSDYGIEHPMVYDIAGIKFADKIPILAEHWYPIGHTTNMVKSENSITGVGVASYPGQRRDDFVTAMRNGFPMQASMGLAKDVFNKIEFYDKGKSVFVNGKTHHGPVLVAREATMVEMTATMSGRDSNTKFDVLNKEEIEVLKNSYKPQYINNSAPNKEETADETPKSEEGKGATSTEASGSADTGTDNSTSDDKTKSTPESGASNSVPQYNGILVNSLYTRYADQAETIDSMVKNGLSFDSMKDKLELNKIKNGTPGMPVLRNSGKKTGADDNRILAHFALSMGVSPETMEKMGIDKKTIDNANDSHQWSFVETLVNISNSVGGKYSGHSDVENMCKFLKNNCTGAALQNTGGFSTFSMPNLFERTTQFILEERLAMQKPFATDMCKHESNKDFREEQHIKANGGEIWQTVNKNGRLPHTHFGEESQYTNKIKTIGQIVSFDRETIVNDSYGIIKEMLEAMVEGALIHPDIQLLRLMMRDAAAGTFWVNNGNSFTSKPLTHDNLGAALLAAQEYTLKKGTTSIKQMLDDRWVLVTSPNLVKTAWEILNQTHLISNTAVTGAVGQRNFYYGKVDHKVFNQIGNTSFGADATFNLNTSWFLWPKNARYAPYTINFLRGRKKPTIETVDLPSDLLGIGVRGYWEATINERDPEFISRQAA